MDTPLEPLVRAANLNGKLTTVAEAIDYVDLRLNEDQQNHTLVQAARDALYRAEDTGLKSDARIASVKLASALRVVENNKS